MGWPCGSVPHRGQESCSFLFPVLGSLGASLLARGGNRQRWFYVVGGDRMSALGCAEASLGSRAGPGLMQRSVDLLRRWCLPPLPLTHLPGRWWAAGVVGSSWDLSPLGSRSQASDFKDASLVVKSRQESVPSSLIWCPLPSSASCRCPWQPLRPHGQGLLCPRSFPTSSEPLVLETGQHSTSNGSPSDASLLSHWPPQHPCAHVSL